MIQGGSYGSGRKPFQKEKAHAQKRQIDSLSTLGTDREAEPEVQDAQCSSHLKQGVPKQPGHEARDELGWAQQCRDGVGRATEMICGLCTYVGLVRWRLTQKKSLGVLAMRKGRPDELGRKHGGSHLPWSSTWYRGTS